ncbi:hypothetical protein DSO57_1035773 [Entomophthora muscae]|uniref:Uncharacterized protein n=1 Tax=Entomophthora muscae TaxID=34485 RepID=A0ACC2SNU0_9FUNG|nr:hypothetical protein DSO57_1035773 [Entomophthora muscae]
MTPPLTLQSDCPMEIPTATETMFTQLFGVLYITLMGMIDSMVPKSGPWSFLGQSWALPTGPAVPSPESSNGSTYAWLPDSNPHRFRYLENMEAGFREVGPSDNVGPFHATSKEL